MAQLLAGRRLEALDPNPARVHRRHEVADRPVLPGRVEALQDDDDAVRVLGCEPPLVLAEQVEPLLAQGGPALLVEAARRARIEVAVQPDPPPGGDAERLDQLLESGSAGVDHD